MDNKMQNALESKLRWNLMGSVQGFNGETRIGELEQFLIKRGSGSGELSIVYNALQIISEVPNFPIPASFSFAKMVTLLEKTFGESSLHWAKARMKNKMGIIEFGGCPQNLYGSHLMNGAVPYFFAKEGFTEIDLLDDKYQERVPYFCFDPKITRVDFSERIPHLIRSRKEDETVLKKIQDSILDNYAEVQGKVREYIESGRVPVIVSNHVLSAPLRWLGHTEFFTEFDFWKLPGFHIHNAHVEELSENRGVKGIDVLSKDRQQYLDSFCRAFDIDIELGCFYDRAFLFKNGRYGQPFEGTYFWDNQDCSKICPN